MLTRRTLLFSLAAQPAFAAVPLFGQNSTIKRFTAQALYVPHRDGLRQAAQSPGGEEMWGQQYGQWLAMTGDVRSAWTESLKAFGSKPVHAAPDMGDARAEDAVEAIVRASLGRQVVTINDDHPTSLTRAFAHQVALRLGEEGFTVFAAETFSNPVNPETQALFEARGPVTANVGYYSGDPVYAEMLRDLRDRRWSFAAYEGRDDQKTLVGPDGTRLDEFESREEAQAQNLAARLRADPKARVLVFCGEGHADKHNGDGVPLMGARLVRLGLDPLVVDQISGGLPAPDAKNDNATLRAVLRRFSPRAPIAVWRQDGHPLSPRQPDGAIDLAVFHPHLSEVAGRPGWLAAAPERRLAQADLPAGLSQSALVQAVLRSEAVTANVIPSDQYPLAGGERHASFFLRPGGYEVRVETAQGRRTLSRLDV